MNPKILITLLLLSIKFNSFTQTLSQFEHAGLVDFLIDKTGKYHAVFQENSSYGKPVFIYYTTSINKGVTWAKPVNISNDNTGNGSGNPRILQDVAGNIYAIWKRYGNTESKYPIPDVTLDGPGGYTFGTIFYKVLQSNGWSQPVQVGEYQESQNTWFTTLTPTGSVMIFWAQLSPESIKKSLKTWYYSDYLRIVALNGTTPSAIVDYSSPAAPEYPGGAPPKEGVINLNGYVDAYNKPHLVFEEVHDNVQQIKYHNGATTEVIYNYPKYTTHNNFNYPPVLLLDEKGVEHLIFKPSASTLESEQIWDYNPVSKQSNALMSIDKKGVFITNFQACQGPDGQMAVTVNAGTYSNTECYGQFYKNGIWTNTGLTKNAAKESYFHKEFVGLGGYNTGITSVTKYDSKYSKIAWDREGKKAMLMNLSAYWVAGGISSPSIIFSKIDK